MYAKLINGALRRAPKKITYHNRTVFNPTDEMLSELGYYPVTYTDMPMDAEENKYYTSYWEQRECDIVQRWRLEDIPQVPEVPTEGERLDVLEQAMLELAEVMTNG